MHSKHEILRLFRYRICLIGLKNIGFEYVYSYYLGEEVGVSAEQIRKDLSKFGIKGKKKSGYHIEQLIKDIEGVTGKDEPQNVILVGMGNVGLAIANNYDFVKHNINVIAGFDINPIKLKKKYKIPVFPTSKMEEFIKNNNVFTAIISVPALSAQEVCDQLISYGIKGILNFAPRNLKTPENIFVNNINLCSELSSVIYLARSS
ncbi:MAG: redox-sensing transcriptional repressor Rex [Bacteroidota bacterium]